MKIAIQFLLLAICIVYASAYSHFRDRIPNGNHVPHPCKANFMWYGVGHENVKGGGVRNPFGTDFAYYDYEWNSCLCKLDSDGDGKTNGEELGDPDCVWTPGQVPGRVTQITHPGVCEPYNDPKCAGKNNFVNCNVTYGLDCPAIQNSSAAVQNVTLTIPRTTVPQSDTTYMCTTFDLPINGDFHLIAVTPEIDNSNVMHHIIAYACDDDQVTEAKSRFSSPTSCSMAYCNNLIGAWSLGLDGICLADHMGFRIGTQGYKAVVLEFHWNNPELKSDYTDASGVTLHYTSNRRTYDAGALFVSPVLIQIPPGYATYDQHGGCSPNCTNQMLGNTTIYLTDWSPHMHYLGTGMVVKHKRGNTVLNTLSEPRFYYDSPELMRLQNPWEIQAGDEIDVTCTYQSKNKNDYTFYGERTSDEMCIAIFIYYPFLSTVGTCATTDGYGVCAGNISGNVEEFCDITAFSTLVSTNALVTALACDIEGKECRSTCESSLQVYKQHPCMTSNTKSAILGGLSASGETGQIMLKAFASCDPKPPTISGDNVDTTDKKCPSSASGVRNGIVNLALGTIVVLLLLM